MFVKFHILHHYTVPCGVVCDQVHNDFHAMFVRLPNKLLVIAHRAVICINGIIILDGIGAAVIAFAEFLTDGMDWHRPKDIHAKTLQLVKFGRDAAEVAIRGKITRKNFVNGAATEPVR